jgi:hypothetical protein
MPAGDASESDAGVVVPLNRGYFARVSVEDRELVERYRWRVHLSQKRLVKVYAARSGEQGGTVLMHREILCAPAGLTVDHINGDGLDNRRSNLRLATNAENSRNRVVGFRMRGRRSSRYRGVCFDRSHPKSPWLATIRVNYVKKYLGRFETEEEAAKARLRGEQRYFGAFAPPS